MRPQPDVAVLTDLWPSQSQPFAGTFVRAQVAALRDRFRQVVLVPRLVAPRLHRWVWDDAVNGWQEGFESPGPAARVLRYPMLRVPKAGEARARRLGAAAALALARERPRLVHGHFLYEVGTAAVGLARHLGVPAVVTVHGTDGRWLVDGGVQDRHRAAMLAAARSAERVVVVESSLAERIVAAGVPRSRVRVLPMGVDESVFRPRPREEARRRLGVPADAKLALFVGRPTREKGIEVLEQALGPGLRGVVVGPPYAGSGRIEQAGAQPPEGVALWLAASDVLCLPSFAEGTPVVVAEALACGRPVVASAVGGIPRQVEDGRTGLLVPAGDVDALRDALHAAVTRTWDADELRSASRPYWWSELAPLHAAVYDELLS